jgi:stearoyl-CoA desaturase (delta-9 desaturase)
MSSVAVKRDYVSHHMPVARVTDALRTLKGDKDLGAEIPSNLYTTTESPKTSRGMTTSRKIAAAIIIGAHLFGVVGIYQMLTMPGFLGLKCFMTCMLMYVLTGTTGVTAGVHRLWAHRSYKAKWPARLILALCNTIANQSSIYHWAIEHRVHHRHVDTDADPHNINRGFFYAHMGWLFCPRSDAFAAARKEIDDSDLRADAIVMFQDRHYSWLSVLLSFVAPTIVGGYALGGAYFQAWCIFAMFRWCWTLHVTWTVNSVAHTFGTRPYRPNERATEFAPVSFFSGGEGWHNYHHAFPWDYAASETGGDVYWRFNLARMWIDLFAALGWVSDRKIQRNVWGVEISSPEEAPMPAY